jgi:hypothetical protein
MKAKRDNGGKAPVHYIFTAPDAVDAIVRVMETGANKYGKNDWKRGFEDGEGLDSVLRHIQSHISGNLIDEESQQLHLANAAAGLIMYLDNELREVNYPKKEGV